MGAVARQITAYAPSDSGKLAHVNVQDVLDRVARGDLLREIAADLGCSVPAVHYLIKRNVPADVWMDVRRFAIAARLERSAEEMECAEDAIKLARARESARLWMWRAEREHSDTYCTKPTVAIGVQGGEGGVQLVVYDPATRDAAAQPRIRDVMLNGDEASSTLEHELGDTSSDVGDGSTP